MPYMLLIMEDAEERRERPKDVGTAAYDAMQRFAEGLAADGVLRGADALSTPATRLAIRGGRQSVLDGPFAEAKEIVGGFFLLDVPTRQEAVAIAARCPAAEWATVEVREIGRCWD